MNFYKLENLIDLRLEKMELFQNRCFFYLNYFIEIN